MIKKKHLSFYILALLNMLLVLSLGSCVFDNNELIEDNTTYISAILRDGYIPVRSQTENSINQDATDYEDRINTLAMLVFPTGKIERTAYHFAPTSALTATIPAKKVTPGKNDIYFFANITEGEVKNLTLRSGVEEYLKKKVTFNTDLNKGATPSLGFPMSRVYYEQDIPAGYTFANPYAWKPNWEGGGDLKPVSEFGTDPIQGKVGLIRTCAKITVDIKGEGLPEVAKVEYVNAVTQYSMKQIEARAFTDTEFHTLELFTNSGTALNKALVAYVPESLFDTSNSTTAPTWDATMDKGLNGVNYMVITMKSGKTYTVPVIHNGSHLMTTYIEYAKGAYANYDVVRNNHYRFNINLPADGKELQVAYQVMPWNLIESEMSYKRPAYTFALKVVNTRTNEEKNYTDLNEVIVPPDSYVDIKFSISNPVGALWVASITNGQDFKLEGEFKDVINKTEIVGSNPTKEYNMKITPKALFYKEAKYTQFFISVEGKELDLGVKPGEEGKYVGEGSTKRWNIKQVMQ